MLPLRTYILASLPIVAILVTLGLDYALYRLGMDTISTAVRAVFARYPWIAWIYVGFWCYVGGALTIHWFLNKY
jgi:hypothetical protein